MPYNPRQGGFQALLAKALSTVSLVRWYAGQAGNCRDVDFSYRPLVLAAFRADVR